MVTSYPLCISQLRENPAGVVAGVETVEFPDLETDDCLFPVGTLAKSLAPLSLGFQLQSGDDGARFAGSLRTLGK